MKAVAADPILASGKLPDSFAEVPQSPAKCGNHLKRLAMHDVGGKIAKLSEISGISACFRRSLLIRGLLVQFQQGALHNARRDK